MSDRFNEGLEQGIELGTLKERERIIKLLESVETYPCGWDYNDPIQSVIDLIKGEQK